MQNTYALYDIQVQIRVYVHEWSIEILFPWIDFM